MGTAQSSCWLVSALLLLEALFLTAAWGRAGAGGVAVERVRCDPTLELAQRFSAPVPICARPSPGHASWPRPHLALGGTLIDGVLGAQYAGAS